MGLIPRIESVRDFCSDSDIDSFRRFRCAGLAERRPQEALPELCEGLVRSMSARINGGAVGEYFSHPHPHHHHHHPPHHTLLSLQV